MRGSMIRRLAIAGLAISLVGAVGCSSDDDNGGGENGGATPTVDVPEAKDFSLDAPVKLVALVSDPTNSSDPNTVPDYNDGARMAIDEINDAGGIGGHPIEFVAFDTPPVGDEVLTALDKALAEEPTVLLGPVSSSATLAITSKIEEAKVPLLHATTDPGLATDGDGGNEWTFAQRVRNDQQGVMSAKYLVDELGATNVGILGVDLTFGQQGIAGAKTILGDKAGPERTFPFDATNVTEPIQAMEGVDALFDWGTPNTLIATTVAAAQQGLDVPHVGAASVGFAAFRDGVGDDEILNNVYGFVDCNPQDDSREKTSDWAERFEAKFGYAAAYSSAQMYDAVYMIRQIIEDAESADPEVVRDGLASLDYTDGVCATVYRNSDGFLMQEGVIGHYEDGDFNTVKFYEPYELDD